MSNLTTAKAITFFDVETTSLDSSKSAILQISIITDWEDGRQDVWTTKIKPREVELEFADQEALEMCKYSCAEWESAPRFEEVAEIIARRLAWGPIVGHNVQFDITHVKASFERRGWKPVEKGQKFDASLKMYKFGYPAIDTCALAFLYLPTQSQNLNSLRDHFGISLERAHDAQTDVEDCREVFYRILASTTSSHSQDSE